MSSDKWQKPDEDADPLQGRGLRLTGVFAIVVAVGLVGAWIFRSPDNDIATVGQVAPDFEVENFETKEPIILSNLIDDGDGPIVINLMASWCGPCREEIPELSAFADANPGVVVIGVGVDDRLADFESFITEVQPTYPVGFDEGEMRVRYPTIGLPATLFLDSDGVIVDVFNGTLDRQLLEEMVAELS
jgi:thiol-disulfide isomerase/thioredoxin